MDPLVITLSRSLILVLLLLLATFGFGLFLSETRAARRSGRHWLTGRTMPRKVQS